MDNMKKELVNPIQSAERIFAVLETLAYTGAIGLMDLSGRLGLHKSTVHRMLLSLISMGYAKQDNVTGKYMPTFKLVKLSENIIANTDIVAMVHPLLTELANTSRETVHFVQRRGIDVLYLDKVEPLYPLESTIRMASQIGLTRPMYCSAVGKAILAEMKDEELVYVWEHSVIDKKTKHTIILLEKLKEDLRYVRERGYALDNEENEIGVRCIAASIDNHKGHPEYAFSISAPVGRMKDDRIKKLAYEILFTKESIQKLLGY